MQRALGLRTVFQNRAGDRTDSTSRAFGVIPARPHALATCPTFRRHLRELCRRIVTAWRGSIQETGDTIAVCGSTAPPRRPVSACSAPSIGVPRGHDVLAFMTLPRYGTIRVGKVRPCCSARGLRADRHDKLLKWLDTEGRNCTPNNRHSA